MRDSIADMPRSRSGVTTAVEPQIARRSRPAPRASRHPTARRARSRSTEAKPRVVGASAGAPYYTRT